MVFIVLYVLVVLWSKLLNFGWRNFARYKTYSFLCFFGDSLQQFGIIANLFVFF